MGCCSWSNFLITDGIGLFFVLTVPKIFVVLSRLTVTVPKTIEQGPIEFLSLFPHWKQLRMFKVVSVQHVCDERRWTYARSQRLSAAAQQLKNKILEIQPSRKTPHIFSTELNGAIIPSRKNGLFQCIRKCIENEKLHPNLEVRNGNGLYLSHVHIISGNFCVSHHGLGIMYYVFLCRAGDRSSRSKSPCSTCHAVRSEMLQSSVERTHAHIWCK